jgi:hypothetical protein
MAMVALITAGGLVVLLGLADLTDYMLARAGKRSMLHKRVLRDPRAHARGTFNPAAAEAGQNRFKNLVDAPPGD